MNENSHGAMTCGTGCRTSTAVRGPRSAVGRGSLCHGRDPTISHAEGM